jgi:GNAT superfamily N-acetyltransferase
MIRTETLTGAALLPHVPALARLRGEVFREWPYLYEADPAREAEHMRAFVEGEGAAVVVAWREDEIVGMATCQPMRHAGQAVRDAFTGRDVTRHCYFGESVLLPPYRGLGVGVAFFAAREAHARATGHRVAAFCAVERAADDPRRPAGHAPLDAFWQHRGYAHHPELACHFDWRELGDEAAVPHRLSFWLKDLA